MADLRDRLDKEKKHLERLASHAEIKRQEAEEAMQKHAVRQHEVDALELEVEQARIKAMVPHTGAHAGACLASAYASAIGCWKCRQ